jgi:hypothetical protein
MSTRQDWDWTPGSKEVADARGLDEKFAQVHEFAFSEDGERIAVPVKVDDEELTIWTNGEVWDGVFEKLWYARFAPNGRMAALVMSDDEWTLALDGKPWEATFDYAWQVHFARESDAILALVKEGPRYSVATDGQRWEEDFLSIRDFAASPTGGTVAAAVQQVAIKEGDIDGFLEGTWSLAVNGKAWDTNWLNVYDPCVSRDGACVGASVRTGPFAYTVAMDGKPWSRSFGCIWAPTFRGPTAKILVPVMVDGKWTVAEDGEFLWSGRYIQLWQLATSPDGGKVAAVVAPSFGRWTIAVDDKPWSNSWGESVMQPHFCPRGERVAAIVKQDNRWGMAVDGQAWPGTFDMVWDPVFSPSGEHVAAKVEKDGRYTLVVDGRVWSKSFDALWPPAFSPDGSQLLVRSMEGGKAVRSVVKVQEVLG